MLFARFENVASWTAVPIGTTVVPLASPPTYARSAVHLTNTSSTQTVFVGYATTVTATHYVKRLAPGEFFEIQAGPAVGLFGIASAAGGSLSIAEVA